jgi:Holliday junction resolvase RusA-like endonuclease
LIIEFTLPIKAYSINKMYYATRKVLTKEARAWQDNVVAQLGPYDLASKGPLIDGKPLRVEIEVTYPMNIFYNTHGLISSKTMDCSNVEKSIIDVVFGQLGVNDKYIIELYSTKRAGDNYKISFRIET